MENARNGKERQLAYKHEYKHFQKAIKEEFFLEAIAIGYAIIEDRLVSFFHHAGIVSRNRDNLTVNRSVYPYMRRLLEKDDNYSIRIKDVSVKIALICKLLCLTEKHAKEIDASVGVYLTEKSRKGIVRPGYMSDLYKHIEATIDRELIIDIFYEFEPWRIERNQLIHALLSKTAESSELAKRKCAEKGYDLTRCLDNCLVKPFKASNKLRQKYHIQ